ncbi:MAG TPA: hypothetical protein V6C78_23505 [Crinalium sp.]|jgi:hypothetical protein
MKHLRRFVLLILGLYLLYLVKSALGINLSERYHAADILKMPLRVLVRQQG